MAIKNELQQLKGVGPTTVAKLEETGVGTLMALAVSPPADIASTTGMSETASRKLIKQARELVDLGFEEATKFEKRREKIQKIGTGCPAFDRVLDGGFESGAITEVYGQFGSGKTQLCHLTTVRALKEDPNNKALYVDTENTFRADRIRDFASALQIKHDDALERIFVARAHNSDHQMLLIDEVEKLLQKDDNYRILIVDSLTSHFRSEYIGRGTLAERQQKMNKHMHHLLKLADLYNLVVIVTNQVMAKPDSFYGDPTQPIGGHIVGHNSTFRIYLRPGKKGSIYMALKDSPNLPNGECNFMITKEGFKEVMLSH